MLLSNPSTVYSSNKLNAVKITSAFFPETSVNHNRELSKPKPVSPLKLCYGTKTTGNDGGGKAETITGGSTVKQDTVHIFNLQVDLRTNTKSVLL